MNSPNESGKSWEVGEEPLGAVLNAVGCVSFLPRPADCQCLRCQGLKGSGVENITSSKIFPEKQIKKQRPTVRQTWESMAQGGPGSPSALMPALGYLRGRCDFPWVAWDSVGSVFLETAECSCYFLW